ncbi:MAG: class I SAM-dependent methyltransferase [Bacteroidia bacterium]
MNHQIKDLVANYYTDKLRQFGATPAGVDWNSEASQLLRFAQLLQMIEQKNEPFSLMDYGCGFGAMYSFMQQNYPNFQYVGFDISPEMIKTAQEKYPNANNTQWKTSLLEQDTCDYVVASGIFNVKLAVNTEDWETYIEDTLKDMNARAKKGFSFNLLTTYSDKEYMKDYLHYANPAFLFDYCKRNFSKQVALLHDYPLYEFTILVRK